MFVRLFVFPPFLLRPSLNKIFPCLSPSSGIRLSVSAISCWYPLERINCSKT